MADQNHKMKDYPQWPYKLTLYAIGILAPSGVFSASIPSSESSYADKAQTAASAFLLIVYVVAVFTGLLHLQPLPMNLLSVLRFDNDLQFFQLFEIFQSHFIKFDFWVNKFC